jgi:signal transduction histidine kinase
MPASGYSALRLAGDMPAGPATTTLNAVIARTAAALRGLTLAYIVIQVTIWHSFYAADPVRLIGPGLALLEGAAVVVWLRRGRAGWPLAVADTAALAALALLAESCVPPAMRGDTSNWLYLAQVTQVLVPAWFTPAAVAAPLVLAAAAANFAAADLAGTAVRRSPVAGAATLLGLAVVAWCGRWIVQRRAAAADASLALADRESQAEYVSLSRSTERREQDRLLHDTVLNTLTALARGGDSAAGDVQARCRHDVTLMEYALRPARPVDEAALGPCGGLLIGLQAVAAEVRARGLTVHFEVHGQERPAVPVPVATALAHAAREALVNVASHAGTGEAWVEVTLSGQAVGVTVRDEGTGFDPDKVDPARLGLRRSVVERVTDWGGQAQVVSAPGRGAEVRLSWTELSMLSEPSEPSEPPEPSNLPDLSDLSEHEVPC